ERAFGAEQVSSNVVIVLEFEGDAEVRHTNVITWTKSYRGQFLKPGDHFRTKTRSRATLTFPKHRSVRLDESSEVEIITSPEKGGSTKVVLKTGRAYEVIKHTDGGREIYTLTGVAGVKNTEFMVSVEPEGRTVIDVIDGTVSFETPQGMTNASA